MTRKGMVAACVDEQIARGVVRPENRRRQIRARLRGDGIFRPMSLRECREWYEDVFGLRGQ